MTAALATKTFKNDSKDKYRTNGATDTQVDLIIDLTLEAGFSAPTVEKIATWDMIKGAELIEWFSARKLNRRMNAIVPNGKYALRASAMPWYKGGNDIVFYEVSLETKPGKWQGFVGIDQIAGEDNHRVTGANRYRVLEAIAADLEGAAALFGQELVRCGICNRKLTVKDSRERGIGPKCASRLGF